MMPARSSTWRGARPAPLRALSPRAVASASAVLAALLSLSWAGRASAWACGRLDCAKWCTPPTYTIGPLSSDLEAIAAGTSSSEVNAAMHDWTVVTCTGLTSSEAGTSSMAPVYGDGVDTIAWYEADWPHDPNVIGTTTVSAVSGCIVEADIDFNGVNYAFTTSPGSPGVVNAYSAALHESGHFYGLGHSEYSNAAMYFSYSLGTRIITPDDANGICSLYPGSVPPPDCSVVGCPRGEECQSSVCVESPVPPCTTDSSCSATQRCDLASGLCVNRDPGAGLGMICTTDADCSTGFCASTAAGSICSQTCDALNTYSCPDGFYCSGSAVDDCAIGICLAGRPGSSELGRPCSKDSDCASLFCAAGACSTPCPPGAGTFCPSGFVCHPMAKGACGACGTTFGNGTACDFDNECMSGLCYAASTTTPGFCTSLCTTDAGCGSGFRCETVGSEKVCVKIPATSGGSGCGCRTVPTGTSSEAAAFLLLFTGLAVARSARKRSRG